MSSSCCTPTRLLYLRDGIGLSGVAHIINMITLSKDVPSSPNTVNHMDPTLTRENGGVGREDVSVRSKAILNDELRPITSVILDRSHFYPQGGGQPFDTGVIKGTDFSMTVESVHFDSSTDQIIHQGRLEESPFEDGNLVSKLPYPISYQVDADKRLLHNRLHSAGHLLDVVVMDVLNYGANFTVSKAFHFPQGPNVEYIGKFPLDLISTPKAKEELMREIERRCSSLIEKDLLVYISFKEEEKFLQDGITPNDKATRYMSIQHYPRLIPCGGTHVNSLKEIGRVKIRKIESKPSSSITKISYQVE